jgi:GTP cyclohydrolase I
MIDSHPASLATFPGVHGLRPNGSEAHALRVSDAADMPEVDQPRIAAAVREILLALGEDPEREGLLDTPKRVAKAYSELFGGLRQDPSEVLARTFDQPSSDLVTLRDIEFFSFCEHHLLPFFGQASIAYLPANGRVVGLSKLARLVEVYARRPQMQERITAQVADAMMEHLDPVGVTVMVHSEHLCMKARGVAKHEPVMTTVAHRGAFATDGDLRREVLDVLRGHS